jgi:hypothetical protein
MAAMRPSNWDRRDRSTCSIMRYEAARFCASPRLADSERKRRRPEAPMVALTRPMVLIRATCSGEGGPEACPWADDTALISTGTSIA